MFRFVGRRTPNHKVSLLNTLRFASAQKLARALKVEQDQAKIKTLQLKAEQDVSNHLKSAYLAGRLRIKYNPANASVNYKEEILFTDKGKLPKYVDTLQKKIEVAVSEAEWKDIVSEATKLVKLQEKLIKIDSPIFKKKLSQYLEETGVTPNSKVFLRQLNLEIETTEHAKEELEELLQQDWNKNAIQKRKPITALKLAWYPLLVEAIEQEKLNIAARVPGKKRDIYGQYLLEIASDAAAIITINETLEDLSRQGGRAVYAVLVQRIGKEVEKQIAIQYWKEPRKNGESLYQKLYRRYQRGGFTSRPIRSHLKNIANNQADPQAWPKDVCSMVGATLFQCFINTAQIKNKHGVNVAVLQHNVEEQVPSNKTLKRDVFAKKIGFIRPEATLQKLLARDRPPESQKHDYSRKPMLIRPRPWKSYNDGCYLTDKVCLLKDTDGHEQLVPLKSVDISKISAGLDAVASTAWMINDRVFQIMEQVWQDGGNFGRLPPKADLPIPEKPMKKKQLHQEFKNNPAGLGKALKERRERIKEIREAEKINQERYALRCEATYKMESAEEFIEDEFYFPYFIDFRGRAYPFPPYLSHLGSDLARGLIMFSERKQITKDGWHWMLVHFANLMGNDKISNKERAGYTMEHIEDIVDSARDPLGGNCFWKQADDPWQCLATCFEISDALNSPNKYEFASCLPVHQDGSCNGLQHYAALGRDLNGGTHVNLVNSDKPRDVYQGVCDDISEKIEADAADKSSKHHKIALTLRGKVTRKIVKQTVMTSVYGVTFIGARLQIEKQLKARRDIKLESKQNLWKASTYIAHLTLGSLGKVFEEATAIQTWLGQCSLLVVTSGHPVSWITPLGLPVVQDYRKGSQSIKTPLQAINLNSNSTGDVIARRQRAAFPPNYVHSLDSSHMLRTAITCKKENIVFAAVHDSYWTHAADIPKMSTILREEFVKLHSENLLEALRESFVMRFPDINFPKLPARGQLDLDEVNKSTYFFS